MRLQLTACLSKGEVSQETMAQAPSNLWLIPSADPSAPPRVVRGSRSILRKLRRIQRMNPEGYFDKPIFKPEGDRELSRTQFIEYMIRVLGWSRVRSYHLGPTWRDIVLRMFEALAAQGDATCLKRAGSCNAPLSPD